MSKSETSESSASKDLPKESMPVLLLLTAYSVKGKPTGKLSPVANTLIISNSTEILQHMPEEAQLLATSETGIIYRLGEASLKLDQPIHDIFQKRRRIILPPPDVVSFIRQVAEENKDKVWLRKVINELKESIPPSDVKTYEVKKYRLSDLRRPQDSLKDASYAKWYQKQDRSQPIYAYTIPKTRALICIVNKNIPVAFSENIELIKPNTPIGTKSRLTWLPDPFGNFRISIISGTDKSLPTGIYKFRVPLDEDRVLAQSTHWNTLSKEPDQNGIYTYTIAEMARFGISNPAGEFDIISLDPISLEESMIVQYARFYSHLISYVNNNPKLKVEDPNDTNNKKAKISDNESKVPPGLMSYATNWSVLSSKSQLVAGLASTDLGVQLDDHGNRVYHGPSSLLTAVGKALHAHTTQLQSPEITASLNAFFVLSDGKGAFDQFREARTAWTRLQSGASPSVTDALRNAYFGLSATAEEVDQYSRSIAGRVGIPHKAITAFGKGAAIVDLGVNIKALSTGAFTHFTKTLPDLPKAKKAFVDLSKDYFDLLSEKKIQESITLRGLFELNKSEVNPKFEDEIAGRVKPIISALADQPDLKVIVEGHTCNVGGFEYNKALSLRRAEAVKKVLVKLGVDESRIQAEGHGEVSGEEENSSREKRAKNRRVVIKSTAIGKRLVTPSREGMGTLERYRNLTIQRSLKNQDDSLKLLGQATDVALGIMSVIPLTAPAALTIIAFKASLDVVGSLAASIDTLVAKNALKHFIDDKKKELTLARESGSNKKLLIELFDGLKDHDPVPGPTEWAAQYRVRSEAIAGLIELLLLASSKAERDDSPTTSQSVKTESYEWYVNKYCIRQYIENFILGDGWLYPIEGSITPSMASYWLYAINEYDNYYANECRVDKRITFGINEDKKLLTPEEFDQVQQEVGNLMKGMGPKNSLFANIGARHVMCTQKTRHVGRHVTTEFQRYFPVHNAYAMNMPEDIDGTAKFMAFANTFRPVVRHVTTASMAYTRIYFKDKSGEWKPFLVGGRTYKAHRNTLSESGYEFEDLIPIVSPVTPIRVLIVFKNEKDLPPVFPIRFSFNRTDGINVGTEGHYYQCLAKPLEETDFILPEEKQYEGQIGCVFHPFYQLWDKTIYGIKPIVRSLDLFLSQSVIEHYNEGGFDRMTYEICCKIGDNQHNIAIPLKGEDYFGKGVYERGLRAPYQKDEVPISLDSSDPTQAFMLEKGFLINRTKDFSLPVLYDGKKRLHLSIKVGKRSSFISADTQNAGGVYSSYFASAIRETERHTGIDVTAKGSKLSFANFDWEEPVEFIATFGCTKLKSDNYKDKPVDWRKIPCYADMETDVISNWDLDLRNHPGPKLKSNMLFLGKITMLKGVVVDYDSTNVKLKVDGTFAGGDIRRIYEQLKHFKHLENDQLEQLALLFPNPNYETRQEEQSAFKPDTWYIFAAHYKCSYYSPKAVKVGSLRPFGKGLFERAGSNEFIKYYLRNFTSAGQAGLKENEAKVRLASLPKPVEPTFEFSIPNSFTSKKTPWGKVGDIKKFEYLQDIDDELYEDLKTPGLSEKAAKEWLDDDAQKVAKYYNGLLKLGYEN